MKSVSAFLIVFFVTSFIFNFALPAGQYEPVVYQIQKVLEAQGYDPGLLDGQWGQSTRNAVEQFQRDSGLPITGIPDQSTKFNLGIISFKKGY